MGKSKATKKFETRHLGDTLKRRKDVFKIKQRQKLADKRKARHKQNDEHNKTEEVAQGAVNGAKPLKDMTVDEFFQGFDVPERSNKKRKRAGVNIDKSSLKHTKKAKAAGGLDDEDEMGSSQQVVNADDLLEDEDSEDEDEPENSDKDDEDGHREQLDALAEDDPEFYKYLLDNDAELLDFEQSEFSQSEFSQSEDSAEDPSEDEMTQKEQKQSNNDNSINNEHSDRAERTGKNMLSLALVQKWETSIKVQHSLRSAREVVLAFRSAVHINESGEKVYKYAVTDSDAYNKLMLLALGALPELIQHHVSIKETASGKYTVPENSDKLNAIRRMVKSHIASLIHLLGNLSDGSTMRVTLSSALALLPYTLVYRKLIKDLGKATLAIWSDLASDEATKIASFLILRKLVVTGDAGVREAILKATYQALVKGCRSTTAHTLSRINLMKNSAAELWAIDQSIGYTTGFGFIRQLAIHLRSTITNKTQDSHKAVYNWQTVHSLDFWSRVMAQTCSGLQEAKTAKQSQLRPLIYPVVQVSLGVMRLIPTAQYFPLRFQLFRSLLRISRATHTYIPLAPALYEVLMSAEMRKPPKQSTVKPLDFAVSIRAGKSLLRTRVYQDGIAEQVVELFAEFFVLWTKSIAFPELALPVIVMLKRWLKDVSRTAKPKAKSKSKSNRNHKLTSSLALLVQKLEANSHWIEKRRAHVDYAPNNRASVDKFLSDEVWQNTPLGAFVLGQRKLRDEKLRLMDSAQRQPSADTDTDTNEPDIAGGAFEDGDDSDAASQLQESELE